MRNPTLLEKMMKRPLVLAVFATFAVAGCATTELAQSPEPVSWTGPAGPAGPQGATGPTGARGPTAGGWTQYRDYTFNVDSNEILGSDGNKAREIADYMNQNPSARVAIDGTNQTRVASVRNALIDAGVPVSKIQTGTFDKPQLRRDGRVAVLVR